ncbi:Serine/arginine-rich splicing factor SR45 [Colletotrichum fructicola]|nr:Serine/arginine-rich splicing factor SR45 [Colletotrichum fructicola]
MASRSRSRSPGDRYRSRTRSPTPRSDRGRSASRSPVRRRDYDSRSPSRSQSPAPRRNGRYRSESRSRSRGRSQSPVVRSTKIVVERLTKNINEGHLEEIFSQFGPIKDLDLPINRTYGTNRGTAYILYDHEADAEEAIAHMHEAQIDGAVINVSIVLPRRKLSPPPPMARRGAGYDPRLPALAGRGSGRQSGAPHAGASGPGSFGQNGPRRVDRASKTRRAWAHKLTQQMSRMPHFSLSTIPIRETICRARIGPVGRVDLVIEAKTHLGSFVGDSDRFPAGRRGGLPFIQHQSDWLSGPTTAQSGGELPECLRHLPLTRSPTPRNSVPHEMLGWDASQGRRGEIHRGKPTAGLS